MSCVSLKRTANDPFPTDVCGLLLTTSSRLDTIDEDMAIRNLSTALSVDKGLISITT